MNKLSKLVSRITVAALLLAVVPAWAGDDQAAKPKEDKAAIKKAPPKEPTAPAGAAADVKAGTGIAKREPVGAAESFAKGTKVWVWSSITGAKGTAVKHVWKSGDKVLWEKEIDVTSGRYRTWTRRSMSKPGSYTVEVQSADGAVLGSVAFTIE